MPNQTKKTKHSSVIVAETDIDPPDNWQPNEEDLRQMKEAPVFEIDLDLGGAKEEKEGEEWLKEQATLRNLQNDRIVTSKEILSFIQSLRKSR